MKYFFKMYRAFLMLLSMPIILSDYLRRDTGREYNVGLGTKVLLIFKMIRNNVRIISASTFLEHLMMGTTILNIPKSVEGVVVECGSYKGGSTSNLSLVCKLCNRQFEVFDSFQGLPEPSGNDKAHVVIVSQEVHTYSKGAWRGTLEEVKRNITRFGEIEVCNFHVGYFDSTLPTFEKKCSFIFLDVDLRDSLESCLKNLWPLLQDGCSLYTHEAPHMEFAYLFFDKEWWSKHLDFNPPGLIGAGTGLGLVPTSGGFVSGLGYTIKNPRVLNFKEVGQTGVK